MPTKPSAICAKDVVGTCEHGASPKFWQFYAQLPEAAQRLVDENYNLLKVDSWHPSLHFKKAGRFWSVRGGIRYRAVAVEDGSDIVWFWIGHHSNYDRIISGRRG